MSETSIEAQLESLGAELQELTKIINEIEQQAKELNERLQA